MSAPAWMRSGSVQVKRNSCCHFISSAPVSAFRWNSVTRVATERSESTLNVPLVELRGSCGEGVCSNFWRTQVPVAGTPLAGATAAR